MNTEAIIEQIDAEISKLQQAKVLLNGVAVASTKRAVGRPKSVVAARILSVTPAKPVKRGMSVEGKARIAEAQKRRWAKTKRAANKAAKVAAVKSVAKVLKPTPVKAVKKAVKKTVPATKAVPEIKS